MSWVLRTIVVPDAFVTLAKSLTGGLAGEAGEGMFTTGLSPTGAGPATHWVSSGLIQEEFALLLSDAALIYEAAGGQVPLSSLEGLLEQSTIREADNPHALFEELGLKLIQEQ